jgi:hypothetical protein
VTGEVISIGEIHRTFAESPHGQKLAGQVSYGRYKPDSVSNERWQRLLGADVNNLHHLPLTHGLMTSMIKHIKLDHPTLLRPGEARILQVAAITHDWAEAVVGDINYSSKTNADEEKEAAVFDGIIESWPEEIHEELLSAADVVFGRDTGRPHLITIFNFVERIGYMRTALRASDKIVSGQAGDSHDGLRWLVTDVMANTLGHMATNSGMYRPVDRYLTGVADRVDVALGHADEAVFANYPESERSVMIVKYTNSTAAWAGFMATKQEAEFSADDFVASSPNGLTPSWESVDSLVDSAGF